MTAVNPTPTIDTSTYHGLDVNGGAPTAPDSLIRFRAGTSQQWADAETAGPVVAAGEIVVVAGQLVRGDGVTKVASLTRIGASSSGLQAANNLSDVASPGTALTNLGGATAASVTTETTRATTAEAAAKSSAIGAAAGLALVFGV